MINKDAYVFKQNLKGNWTPLDVFGTPMIVGEIILYATGGGSGGIDWRVGKIVEIIDKPDPYRPRYGIKKMKMKRATKGYNHAKGSIWELQERCAYLSNVENAFVLTHPSPEIAALFKDVT